MRIVFLILSLVYLIFTSPVLATFTFTIPQSNINEDQEIEATVNLSLQNQANKTYYLEGAFKKEGGANYFGQSWNNTDWVGYTATNADKSLKSITTSPEGSWSGTLKVKLDTSSPQFSGSGNYILKLNRFTSTGSSSTSSDNVIILTVTAYPTPTPPPTPTNTPTPTKTPTPSPKPTNTPTPKPSPTPTPRKTPTPTGPASPRGEGGPKASSSSISVPSSILGTSFSATPTQIESPLKNLVIFGGGLVFILSGTLLATFIRKH